LWRPAPSASEYDQIKAAADTARADLSAARAQASVAQNATGYAVLLADSDGVVMETLAEPGQVVSAGQVAIRLARAGQREALVQLPETLRPAVGSEAQATYGNEKHLSPQRCACFLTRPMPRPAPMTATCWMARWRTRRWGRPSR
jgi:hypothetical protein